MQILQIALRSIDLSVKLLSFYFTNQNPVFVDMG